MTVKDGVIRRDGYSNRRGVIEGVIRMVIACNRRSNEKG